MSEIINPLTKRFVKIGSPAYKRLVRAGTLPPASEEPEKPEFNEKILQTKLADVSTDIIRDNLKTIIKSQKLSDKEMDMLLKKMLFDKLCIAKPEKKEKDKKKKKKFKIVEPSSESESESD